MRGLRLECQKSRTGLWWGPVSKGGIAIRKLD